MSEFEIGDWVIVKSDNPAYYGNARSGEEGKIAGIGRNVIWLDMDDHREESLPYGTGTSEECMKECEWHTGYMAVVRPNSIKKINSHNEEKKEQPLSSCDPVSNPSHYTTGSIECIEAIKASMSHEAFCGYLKGTLMAYTWRYEKKIDPVEDLSKASWYLDRLRKEQNDD